MSINSEFTPIDFGTELQGTLEVVPHAPIYTIPAFEVHHVDHDTIMPNDVRYKMEKTYRGFTIFDASGNEHYAVVAVGHEFSNTYTVDFRPLSPVEGVSYPNLGFNNRAVVMVQDSFIYQHSHLAQMMLRADLIDKATISKIATFNIISRLPQLATFNGKPAVNIDEATGSARFSEQRHPLINASKFLDWGIEHLDNMPLETAKAYGVKTGPVTGVTLAWEQGGTNYKRFMKEYSRSGNLEAALRSTFSVQRFRERGFVGIRGVSIDYVDASSAMIGRIKLLREPNLINVFLDRSEVWTSYVVMTNKGSRAGEFSVELTD